VLVLSNLWSYAKFCQKGGGKKELSEKILVISFVLWKSNFASNYYLENLFEKKLKKKLKKK
jgi:hypothetical protein